VIPDGTGAELNDSAKYRWPYIVSGALGLTAVGLLVAWIAFDPGLLDSLWQPVGNGVFVWLRLGNWGEDIVFVSWLLGSFWCFSSNRCTAGASIIAGTTGLSASMLILTYELPGASLYVPGFSGAWLIRTSLALGVVSGLVSVTILIAEYGIRPFYTDRIAVLGCTISALLVLGVVLPMPGVIEIGGEPSISAGSFAVRLPATGLILIGFSLALPMFATQLHSRRRGGLILLVWSLPLLVSQVLAPIMIGQYQLADDQGWSAGSFVTIAGSALSVILAVHMMKRRQLSSSTETNTALAWASTGTVNKAG